MRVWNVFGNATGLLAPGLALTLCLVAPARADVISATPTLPLLGIPYVASGGAPNCFSVAAVCVTGASLTLTSVVSDIFNPSGQDIVTDASFGATLTTIGGTLIGPVSLSGTVEQEILGRTASGQTGSWTTDLVGLALGGPVLGHTLTLGLDGSQTSSGTSSITPDGMGMYRIDSFFDVFVTLDLDSNPPLTAYRGPIQIEPVQVPEPASLILMASAGLGLLAVRRRG